MTQQKTLRDSAAMRWTALLLLALAMFCAYIFMDILSPIKDLMLETRGWDSTAFGTMQGAETFLNVFVFFLIFAGIILDKMGVRFTAVLSGAVMLVGALIGQLTRETDFAQINLVLYIAMGVFAAAFFALAFIPIKDPEIGKVTAATTFEYSPWSFRHCTLGVIAIFVYVGVEVGIPGTLNFYISDTSAKGAGLLENAAAIGGFVAGTYWLLMLVGRICSSFIASKVSSKMMMIVTSGAGMLFILLAIFIPKTVMTSMPLFTGSSFAMTEVPISAMLLVLCGLCTSVMWASIFNLATEGLGKYTAQASGIFMMMVVGGGVLPLIQNFIADSAGYMVSYFVPLLAMGYMFWYALIGSKNVNTDIPVE